MTGSEGGFSPAEVDLSAAAGILPVSLGRRILRCETAPLAALAALMFCLGEME
jgi:16S rRNA (uracil1498-N3)-methyltransferase